MKACRTAATSTPVPDYIPPFESPDSNPELAKKYPLNIVSPKPHAFLNSQYGNASDKQRAQGEQRVFIHPADAAEREIAEGQLCGCSTTGVLLRPGRAGRPRLCPAW